jgi:hypothetical protein
MNGLLANIVEAHGGLARWNSLEKAEATVVGSGGFCAVQLTSVYTEADGIRLSTQRRAHASTPGRMPIKEMVMVSIDISDVSYT